MARYKRGVFAAVALFLLSAALIPAHAETEAALVTTRTALLEAIHTAKDGDIICVGDIEFHDYPSGWQILNSAMRVTVDKSITIKGAKPDGSKAVFTGGSVIIDGPQGDAQKISCAFENILFDGGVNGSELVLEDWGYADEMDLEPRKAQFAVTFLGNVDAAFTNCGFTRYMHESGSAMLCLYGDYDWAQPGDFLYDYRYNKFCDLNLSLINCEFAENTAYYAGGAVYLDGESITLNAESCDFVNNNSSIGSVMNNDGFISFSGGGGGAIYAYRSQVSFMNCDITGNTANRVYGDAHNDRTFGGGIHIQAGTLDMTNCIISNNTASKGGGLYILMTETMIDGCDISENSASTSVTVREEEYVWNNEEEAYMGPPDKVTIGKELTAMRSDVGWGGGAYIEIINPVSVTFQNTSIVKNSAQNAYGGFYANYSDWYVPLDGFGKIDFIFCTYADNRCEYDYSHIKDRVLWGDVPADQPVTDNIIWFTLPGDVWEIAYAAPFGCVISDEDFGAAYPRYELPSEGNGYTYFASPRQASDDGVLNGSESMPVYEIPAGVAKTLFSGRFADVGGRLYAGRNEALRLKDAERGFFVWGIIFIVCGLCGGAVFLFFRRRRIPAEGTEPEKPESAESPAVSVASEYSLTARETEVATLYIGGKTQKEIAEELFIGVTTVKTHLKNVYGKVGVNNKFELIEKWKS